MADPSAAQTELLDRLSPILACPECRGSLRADPAGLGCEGCGSTYPVSDGIPLFARRGSSETWVEAGAAGGGSPAERGGGVEGEDAAQGAGRTSREYQDNYEQVARAAQYNEKYRRKRLKRWSTHRELQLLRRLLGGQPRSETLLDLPCGGGRLSTAIAPFTDLLLEADIALGQILYGKANSSCSTPRFWMTASAFHIPLRDRSVDAVVSVRLCHHLPVPEERERLVRELLRVSRRFVLMTFFDHNSPKNLLRRARRALGLDRKSPKNSMTVCRVAELAREEGAELVACPYLSVLGSGHRYALLVRAAG